MTPPLPWPDIFECFFLFAIEDAAIPIAPKTADEYVSHVLKMLEHTQGRWDIRATARTPRFKAVYTAAHREHLTNKPHRTTSRIPFTVPFIVWALAYIDRTYPDRALQRVLKAAISAGHALSMRPGEFLKSSKNYAPERYLRAGTTYAWFNDEAFPASDASMWPAGLPSHISSILEIRKNTLEGGSLAMAANPLPPAPGRFCSVTLMSDYIRHANLTMEDPLFCYQGHHLDTKFISTIMKACAAHFGIDESRIMPASLRKNVITQMPLDTPEILRRRQGGWQSNAGDKFYCADLMQTATANAAAVHSAGGATINVIKTFMGKGSGDLPPRERQHF